MDEQRLQEKIKKLKDELSKVQKSSFLQENHVSLKITITTYLILRNTFHTYGVDHYNDFKRQFSSFYGMHRFTGGDNFIDRFFAKMKKLKSTTEYDVKELAEELTTGKDGKEKIQFSFTTKLLNMLNDAEYPIYDSNVAKVFGFWAPPPNIDIKDRIEKYASDYEIIQKTYQELIPNFPDLILKFRDDFKLTENELSDMRIIDFIVWKRGEEMKQNSPEGTICE